MAVAPWRRDAVALSGVLVLVAVAMVVGYKIHASDKPTVYGIYIGLVSLLASLLAYLIKWWWKGRRATAVVQVAAAADQLAQRMLETWRQQAKERRISTPAPVRVWWRWGPPEVTPPRVEVSTVPVSGTGPRPLPDPSPGGSDPDPPGVLLDAGIVTRLHEEVYGNLPHGRLVLLGERGAGKTGAMILLLLAALEHRRSVGEAGRGEVPVPVWLTLGGWNPTTQTLYQWAAATMYRDHPYLRASDYGPNIAEELLRTGRVALFLDGLDEMAPSAQAKALARIEQEGAGLRLVLSSRPGEYLQAITEGRVHNTAVIELQPVDPQEARAYLLRDQLGSQRDRWVQLGDYLTQHPGSIAAQALNTPLTLSLARATYQDQDPTSLTDSAKFATVAALREHLIDRILIVAYPEERQRAHATYWLSWIAYHLGTDRDLAWWRIPTWIPRWQLRFVGGLVGGFVGGFVGGLKAGVVVGLVVVVVVGVGVGVGLIALLAFWTVPLPRAATTTRTPTATYRIDRQTSSHNGLMSVLQLGIVFVLAGGLRGGLMVGLMFGLAVGLMVGFVALSHGSMELSLTELILATTRAGSVKFIRLLEDAHKREVLRQAGAVYQFRHAELQDHLAKIHRNHTQPLTTT